MKPNESASIHEALSDNLVVIASSAGGLDAIGQILSALPADFPAAVAIVQHRGDQMPDLLPDILRKKTGLNVRHARDGERPEPGTVYICPPGVHMTVERSLRLVEGPRIKHVRPNADLMFQSAAQAYGAQAIGVVLTGFGTDGARGCQALLKAGATVIAQEPESCSVPDMPVAAIGLGKAGIVYPLDRIAAELVAILTKRTQPQTEAPATRVLLADDHRIIRQGLRTLLESEPGFDIVGEADDGAVAVRLAAEVAPHVVVMDIAMPDVDGVTATREILAHAPQIKVVVLSALSDARSASRVLRAGAVGYLTKHTAFDELTLAIRTVLNDKVYLSPEITRDFVAYHLQHVPADAES